MTERFSELGMLEHAARALGKIDTRGRRGTSMVSWDEIEAMACLLALYGLPPIDPGQPIADPARFFAGELTIPGGLR